MHSETYEKRTVWEQHKLEPSYCLIEWLSSFNA